MPRRGPGPHRPHSTDDLARDLVGCHMPESGEYTGTVAAHRAGAALRIGFVFDDTLDTADGVQQHIVTLGRELARLGHHVEYLVGQTRHSPVPHTHSLSTNVMVSFNGNRMRIPVSAKGHELDATLDDGDFDVLDVQAPYSPLLAGRIIARAHPSTGVVATYHIAPTGPLSLGGGVLLGAINHHTHRRIDVVTAVSDVAADYARTTAHAASTVIPNPIDVAGLLPRRHTAGADTVHRLHGDGPHVVFMGRFVARKGAENLLDALRWGEDHDLFPEGLHVTMAGKGPLLEACRSRAAALRTPVRFPGFITEADKPALLGSADIAVFPSISGESFGIVLLEAVASGSHVVLAGDNPGYRSTLLGDENALFPVKGTSRAQALAERIQRTLADGAWSDAMHERQTALLHRYDVTTVAPQVLYVYERAIAQRRAMDGASGSSGR